MADIIEPQQSTSDDSNCFEEMIRKETTHYLERAWEAYRRLVRRAAGVELILEAANVSRLTFLLTYLLPLLTLIA